MAAQVERHPVNLPTQTQTNIVPRLRRQTATVQEEHGGSLATPVQRVQTDAPGARECEMARRRGVFESDA